MTSTQGWSDDNLRASAPYVPVIYVKEYFVQRREPRCKPVLCPSCPYVPCVPKHAGTGQRILCTVHTKQHHAIVSVPPYLVT